MYLIQILLPLCDNVRQPYEERVFKAISAELVQKFGGLTAFSRAPAKGTWVNAGHEERDDVIVIEVMAETLDREWWEAYRRRLETDLGQTEIVARAHIIDRNGQRMTLSVDG